MTLAKVSTRNILNFIESVVEDCIMDAMQYKNEIKIQIDLWASEAIGKADYLVYSDLHDSWCLWVDEPGIYEDEDGIAETFAVFHLPTFFISFLNGND